VKYSAGNVATVEATGRGIGSGFAVGTGVAPAFPPAARLSTASATRTLLPRGLCRAADQIPLKPHESIADGAPRSLVAHSCRASLARRRFAAQPVRREPGRRQTGKPAYTCLAESQKRKQTDWLSRLVRPSTPDFYGKATPLTRGDLQRQAVLHRSGSGRPSCAGRPGRRCRASITSRQRQRAVEQVIVHRPGVAACPGSEGAQLRRVAVAAICSGKRCRIGPAVAGPRALAVLVEGAGRQSPHGSGSAMSSGRTCIGQESWRARVARAQLRRVAAAICSGKRCRIGPAATGLRALSGVAARPGSEYAQLRRWLTRARVVLIHFVYSFSRH